MIREFLKLLRKNDLLAQASHSCDEMLEHCNSMVHASVDSLRNREDAEIDVDIFALDKELNAFERDVRRKVMTHLSLGNQEDLSAGLALVSIVIDIERIGDYTKNIYDLARNHESKLDAGPLEAQVKELEIEVLRHFDRTVRAFKEGDAAQASVLMKEYKTDISSRCMEIEGQLVKGQVILPSADAVAVALYLRFLKRISAHARNLISSLVNPFHRIGYKEKTAD